ncbi:unnamed protein product, partial [Mesorhabditis spiculigera]
MSTSAAEAKSDLAAQIPSCSHKQTLLEEADVNSEATCPALCDDLLAKIFARTMRRSSIRSQLRLKRVSRLAHNVVGREMGKKDELLVEILDPTEYRIIGLRKEKLPRPEQNIIVQGSLVHTMDEALKLVKEAVGAMRTLKTLRLYSRENDSEQGNFTSVIQELLGKGNVQLETVKFRRKRVGTGATDSIVRLVEENADSLHSLGQLGLSEAIQCFAGKPMALERLSLNEFDGGFDADQESICERMIQLMSTGITATHLSYSSLQGFDPTDEVVQRFLTSFECESLRLTMMKGPYVPSLPDYMIGKVRHVQKLEMVEVVEKTNIFNTLITYEKMLHKVFPNVEDVNFLQDWRR